jgi:hypothetical protein
MVQGNSLIILVGNARGILFIDQRLLFSQKLIYSGLGNEVGHTLRRVCPLRHYRNFFLIVFPDKSSAHGFWVGTAKLSIK